MSGKILNFMMLFKLLRYSVFFLILIIFSPLIFFIRLIIKKIKSKDILDKYLEIIFNVKTKIILVLINYIGVKSSGFLIEHNLVTYYFKGVKFNINHHFVFTRKTFSLDNTLNNMSKVYNFIDNKIKQPFDTFIDVGANLGFHSLFVAKKYGKNIKILSLEASKQTYNLFLENLKIQDFYVQNIIPINKLVYSSSNQNIKFVNNMFGQNHILNDNFYNKKLTYENVSSETLFNIYKNNNFLNTSSVFVKIDIEGSEYHLFNCLKKIKPQGFIFEVNTRGEAKKYYKIEEFFGDYLCFDLENFKILNSLEEFSTSISKIYSRPGKILSKDLLMLKR